MYILFVGSLSELPSVDNLYEDLHWLLLISGYLLADESNGETPLIPQEIISYSSSLKAQVDIQTTFQTLCASQNQNQGKCCGGTCICFTTLLNLGVKILENSVCRVIIFQSEENCDCSQPFVSSSDSQLTTRNSLANLHILKTRISLERKEVFESSKQHFASYTDYVFMF